MKSPAPLIRVLALLALAAATAASIPEPLRIAGRVLDDETGRPLKSVQVHIPDTGIGTLTDRDGRYTLHLTEALTDTEIQVVAQLVGYDFGSATLRPSQVQVDGSVALDFRLTPSAMGLQELVVTGAQADAVASRPTPVLVAESEARSRHIRRPGAPLHFGPPPADREQYALIEENGFKAAVDNPLSTFSIDVDRASYSNIRRFLLREHRLPPVDAVQVEEMVNYFPYDYVLPEGGEPLAVTTELGRAPWREEHLLLRIGMASAPIETSELPPSNLVFLLDVSGSMQSPDKLPLVKRSMRLLVDQLSEDDRVAIVVYAGAAGLVLEPTSGAHRERILEAIERLEAGGSTAGGAGIRLAYDVARRHFIRGGNNRVILATDGDFNVGESSDAAMTRLVEQRREDGTFLTILGFGTGNLQNTKMQEMAQHGNGNYAYIDGLDEARKVLVGEMGGTLLTVAKDVKIQVEFNPAQVQAYRLIGYENRLLAAEDFNDDRKDAGELGAGHTVTALYEIVPAGSESNVVTPSVDPLRYQTSRGEVETGNRSGRSGHRAASSEDRGELAFVKVRYKDPDGAESRLLTQPVRAHVAAEPSADLRFTSAVAGFGMLLRESEHRGNMTADRVLRLAGSGLGEDLGGYRSGFLEMVRAYQRLTEYTDRDRQGG